MTPLSKLIFLLFILITLGFLYRRYEDKLERENTTSVYEAIQDYLLDDNTLGKSKKPILWIHIPYEYNSRKWLSYGSRSSLDLNQPYLYLTVKSIIKHCKESFTICIFDDNSFKQLMPEWDIDMTRLSDPILSNIRNLGCMRLLQMYGGMMCPISFLCMKDLSNLYYKGIRNDKMFVCETVDRNVTSVNANFYANIAFCGAPKNCDMIGKLCNYLQTLDQSAETEFLGQPNRWCMKRVEKGEMNLINGAEIGTKRVHEDKPILIDDLMSNHYLDLYQDTNGILIPAKELLSRIKFGWFLQLSPKEVVESDTIIGNYLLLSLKEINGEGILEPITVDPSWIGFWKIPSGAPMYGLKPPLLGNNVRKIT